MSLKEESQFIVKEFLKDNCITDEAVIAEVFKFLNSTKPDTLPPLTIPENKICGKSLEIESTGGKAALITITATGDYAVFLTPAHCLMASPELSNDETLWDKETEDIFSGTIPYNDVIIVPSLDFAIFRFYPTIEDKELFAATLSPYDIRPSGTDTDSTLRNTQLGQLLSVTVSQNNNEILYVERQDRNDFLPGDSGTFVCLKEKDTLSAGIVIARGNTKETRKNGIALRFGFIFALLNKGKHSVIGMRELSDQLKTYQDQPESIKQELIQHSLKSLIQDFILLITRMIDIRQAIYDEFNFIAKYAEATEIVRSVYEKGHYAYETLKRTVFLKLYEKEENETSLGDTEEKSKFEKWVEAKVNDLEKNDFKILFNRLTLSYENISEDFLKKHYKGNLNAFDREWISKAIVSQLQKTKSAKMVIDILYGIGREKNTCFLGPEIGTHYKFVWNMLKQYMENDNDVFGKNVDYLSDGVYKVYTQSELPLNFKDPSGKAKLKQRKKDDSKGVYHHPLLCELTEWKPGRSHSCIRPSHHVIGSKHFNDECTKLNKNIGDRLPSTSSKPGPDASDKNMIIEKFKESVIEESDIFPWSSSFAT